MVYYLGIIKECLYNMNLSILSSMLSATDTYVVINVFSIIFMVLMVLLSIAMIIVVILQEGNSSNLGAITGAAETFFGKNKAKSMDAKFKRLTIFIAIAILVCSILYFVLYLLKQNLG